MRRVPKIALLAGAVVIAAATAVAVVLLNNSGGGPNANEKRTILERSISKRLPRQLEQAIQESVSSRSVTCVDEGDSRYACVARVASPNSSGGTEVTSIPLDGSCDERNCVWRINAGEQTNNASAKAGGRRLPPPESLAWVQITCQDVQRALASGDGVWLTQAGRAIAFQALVTRPDANAESLVTAATLILQDICRKASNPHYRPYGRANAVLRRETRP